MSLVTAVTGQRILESVRKWPGRVPLIGRDDDLAILDGWAAEADGALLGLLGGDAGIGKSRLVAEHASRAEADGALVLIGGCLELSTGGVPFGPFADAFRSLRAADLPAATVVGPELALLVPELAADAVREPGASPGLDPVVWQNRLLTSVRRLLESLARTRPVELILEDLHWADPSTRDLLAYLVQTADQPGLVIVGTYRSDELHRHHPLRPFLAEMLRSARVRHHVLMPLTEPAARELGGELIGPAPARVLDNLTQRSRGNPFALEVIAAAHQAGDTRLPAALGDVLMSRLSGLPEPVMDVLRVMAVAGRPVSHELLVALLADVPEDEVEAALSAAIEARQAVVDADDRFAFRHALLAEAVHGTTLPGQRRRLHRQLAEILEQHPEHAVREAPRVELAAHWFGSGDRPRSLAAAVDAIEEAASMYSHAQVAELAERALELWPDVDDPETLTGQTRVGLLRQAAEAAYYAGDLQRAERLVGTALELVDANSEPVLAGRLMERVGRFRWVSGQPADRTEQAYRQAVELIPSFPASSDRAQVLASLGQFMMLRSRLDEAVDWCQQALGMAREAGDELVEGHAASSLGAALSELGDLAGPEFARHALQVAGRLGNIDELGRAYVNLTGSLLDASAWAEAIELGYEGLERGEDFCIPGSYVSGVAENLSRALLAQGRFEDARSCLPGARHAASRVTQAWLALLRSELALLGGDLDAAQRELSIARSLGAGDDPLAFHHHLAVSAAVAAAQGNLGEVDAVVREGLEIIQAETTDLRRVQLAMALARVLDDVPPDEDRAELGEALLENAAAATDRIVERMGDRVIPFVPVVQLELRHRLAELHGDPALPTWEDVAAAWEREGNRINELRARIMAVERALGSGDRERAEAAWVDARKLAGTMDVPAMTERLAGVRRRGRLTVAPSDGGGPYGLTPREQEVLALVANGRTNPQIGKILFISEKTASVHVSNILRKLAVSNRGEAAALALRKGIAG